MADLKQAMKNKDVLAKGVLQLLKAKVDAYCKDNGIDDITSQDFYVLVQSELKQLDQSLGFAQTAGRDDLIAEIGLKKDLLTNYLPKQLSYEEVMNVVQSTIDSSKPMGENMKHYMAHFNGQADNKTISTVVRSYYAK